MPLTKAEITRLRSLKDKKHREAAGLFVIEGEKVVGELLAAGYPLLEIYATGEWRGRASRPDEPFQQAQGPRRVEGARLTEDGSPSVPSKVERGLRTRSEPVRRPGSTQVFRITPAEMARASHFPTPASVLAVGKISRPPLARGALDRGLTLALDGIQDPGNVGTLLRLADWFGLDRVLLSPDSADLFSQKVINASMGSFARVTVHTAGLAEALADCRAPVLGCELAGDDVHSLKPRRDAVIVIGSEGRGLSPAVQARVTQRVTIPKYGGAESLNAATAAAIVCDNLRRVSG